MKKFRWLLLLFLLPVLAFFTKPGDKECIIGGVKAVWGEMVPDEKEMPGLFNQYMDISSENIIVKDRVLFKQVMYEVKGMMKTVAIGAFTSVFATVKPYESNSYIPPMPGS